MYGESLWKDFLTKNIHIDDDITGLVRKDFLQTAESKFAILVLQLYSDEQTEHDINSYISGIQAVLAGKKQNTGIYTRVVRTDKEMLSIIISFPGFFSTEQCMEKLSCLSVRVYESANQDLHPFTYLSVSTVKEHLNQLPLAYRECMEVLKYKLICRSRLLYFNFVKDKQDTYKYPADLEKHLVNNLLAGNTDTCRLLIKRFFKDICNPSLRVEDHEIRSCIYQLQNAVLKSVRGISDHLKIDMDLDISGIFELDIIEMKVMQFIDKITEEIKKKNQYEEHRLCNLVLDYVQNRYMYEDFNLNRAADDLNINRNHLGRIIKEKTGYNFTEYVNRKRIELAKGLLSDKKKNIDDVAKEVGFNYTNYFIKIFRSMEGVTPGQYREAIR